MHRGALGPARYDVTLGVAGTPALRSETVRARLDVDQTPDGARLRLRVGDVPIDALLQRARNGQFVLESVEGVAPRSAGEADLASIVGQLDPPLPERPVRLRDTWSATRRIRTPTLRARMTSRLRLAGYRRVAGHDAVLIDGTIKGALRTSGAAGTYVGAVHGTTRLVWAVDAGHLVESTTKIVWDVPGLGKVSVASTVESA